MDISGMLTGAGAAVGIWVLVSQVRDVVKAKRAERERETKAFRNWIDHRIESVDTRVNGVRDLVFDLCRRLENDAARDRKFAADRLEELDKHLSEAAERLSELANLRASDDRRIDHAFERINKAEKNINEQAATHSEFAHNIVDRLCALEAPLQSAEAPKTLPQAPADWYRNHEAASMPLGTHEWPKNPKA